MEMLVAFLPLVAICAGSAIPSVPEDNSYYVDEESYIRISESEGVPRLLDLKALEDAADSGNSANNQYWLYTRLNPDKPQILVHGDANSVRNSNYATSNPIVVIVHGWHGDGNSPVNPLLRDAFLDVENANVIVVDWSRHASGLYSASVWAGDSVGLSIGNFLTWIISDVGGDWDYVHVIGFSLGAHIAGNAGHTTGGRPGRVTGLDPADPMWGTTSFTLSTKAGQYVEAIHTDGGILGTYESMAHADFYPNGGIGPQPGCSSLPFMGDTCSHSRSCELFAATIRFNHLEGRLCTNITQVENDQCTGSTLFMGNANFTKKGAGIYRLATYGYYPYLRL